MDLKSIFNNKKAPQEVDVPISTGKNMVADVANWYADRYTNLLVQRNILFLLLFLVIGVVLYSVYRVSDISSLYKIQPFVVDTDKKSGLTNIVYPSTGKDLISQEALNQYFIMKYIRSREGYCITDYEYNYNKVVRLYSASNIYGEFNRFIKRSPDSPIVIYRDQICTTVNLRSIQFFNATDPKSKAVTSSVVVRFTVLDTKDAGIRQYKIASIVYGYAATELSLEDREINPLGFQIYQYRVDEEIVRN
jgi:type IV secretion system protein VirB8